MAAGMIAGPALRTLLFENIPGFMIKPKIEELQKNSENSSWWNPSIKTEIKKEEKENKKVDLKKWAHCISAILNIYTTLKAVDYFYAARTFSQKHDSWRTNIGWLLAIVGAGVEREVISSLKNSNALKNHKEKVDFAMPIILAALQAWVTKEPETNSFFK